MKERPILFSAPMVRALLDGSKTQTRRIFKAKNGGVWPNKNDLPSLRQIMRNCPYGQPGDRLWVRETHAPQSDNWGAWERSMQFGCKQDNPIIHYAADKAEAPFIEKWRPSTQMPRWASRITLEIKERRIERLQDISRGDAMAEGCPFPNMAKGFGPCQWYANLWESINGADTWAENPYVWVIEFRRVKP